MSFSIVTVILNSAENLSLTLESIIQQDFEDYEIIVVDGGSDDHIIEILDRYRNYINSFISTEDAGVFFAMNEAVKYCSKEYIIFMNAKDRFYSGNVLSKVRSRIDGTPDIVYGDHVYVYRGEEIFQRSQKFDYTFEQINQGVEEIPWLSLIPCHQATFTRRSVFEEIKYDTRFELCADHELMLRSYDSGLKFQYIDETICHYIGGGLSAQRSERLALEQAYLYRQYSLQPKKIDKVILGNKKSPFSQQTQRTGIYLTGLVEVEQIYPEYGITSEMRLCRKQMFKMITPSDRAVISCIVSGHNIFIEQKLGIYADGLLLASSEIPCGDFEVTFNFDNLIDSRSILEFIFTKYSQLSSKDITLASAWIKEVIFTKVENKSMNLITGERYACDLLSSKITANLFVGGWSYQELNHRWSTGGVSLISVKTDLNAKKLVLQITPNSFLNQPEYLIEVIINKKSTSKYILNNDANIIELNCLDSSWIKDGHNLIMIKNNFAARHANDPRILGFCIHSISAF